MCFIMAKLDKMCYSEFIEYLDSKKIEYQEGTFVDIDFWMEEYVKIVPVGTKKLKERYFSTDGGCQLFC